MLADRGLGKQNARSIADGVAMRRTAYDIIAAVATSDMMNHRIDGEWMVYGGGGAVVCFVRLLPIGSAGDCCSPSSCADCDVSVSRQSVGVDADGDRAVPDGFSSAERRGEEALSRAAAAWCIGGSSMSLWAVDMVPGVELSTQARHSGGDHRISLPVPKRTRSKNKTFPRQDSLSANVNLVSLTATSQQQPCSRVSSSTRRELKNQSTI